MMEHYEKITRALAMEERLAQLAEECGELCQAALKLRRAISGANPTPVSETAARRRLLDEIADVMTCVDVIVMDMDTRAAVDRIDATMSEKAERWANRLTGQGCGVDACRVE